MMKYLKVSGLLIICALTGNLTFGQQVHDKGMFLEYQAGYYQNYILKGIEDFENPHVARTPYTYFGVDLSKDKFPNDLRQYTCVWRQPPISQGNSGTCWSFGATSMMESEIWRVTGESVKLSEMFFVYWDYVDRALDYVKTRGNTYFAEGSESNALPRIMKEYGLMPYEVYSGMLPGQKVHDHEKMIAELETYLLSVKEKNAWNEKEVEKEIRAILDGFMGRPPQSFTYSGKEFTPQSFLTSFCKVQPEDFYSFMSTLSQTYDQKGELVEADNWWHSKDYYNVHLEDFIRIIRYAAEKGYGVCVCGDVSEPGFDRYKQVGMIPTFDIPSAYIDESARELRLTNSSTTDDHCMHLIGYYKEKDQWWYVFKDSGAGAFDGTYKGYRFISEDYIRLKMMNILLYKEAARPVLDKIIK